MSKKKAPGFSPRFEEIGLDSNMAYYDFEEGPVVDAKKVTALVVVNFGLLCIVGAMAAVAGNGSLFFFLMGVQAVANAWAIFTGKLHVETK